jgi:hypothetical protein
MSRDLVCGKEAQKSPSESWRAVNPEKHQLRLACEIVNDAILNIAL